jgi:molybdate transport system ATP-binding protein
MELKMSVKKRLPSFELDVAFSCSSDKLSVLIGPSGAGKTTIIRMIAGLDKPDEGTITFDGETWLDTERGIFVPPQKRQLGYVFQDYPLFPHLNIQKNIAFAAHDETCVERLMKRFDIWHLRNRKVAMISGGERQRCAICQNLARRPRVLLLDEPFSALDAVTRKTLRTEIKELKGELCIPIIHVTHDISEATQLGDELLPIVQGRIVPRWILQFRLKDLSFRRRACIEDTWELNDTYNDNLEVSSL